MFNLFYTKLSLRLAGHDEGSVGALTRRQKLREKNQRGDFITSPTPIPASSWRELTAPPENVCDVIMHLPLIAEAKIKDI